MASPVASPDPPTPKCCSLPRTDTVHSWLSLQGEGEGKGRERGEKREGRENGGGEMGGEGEGKGGGRGEGRRGGGEVYIDAPICE